MKTNIAKAIINMSCMPCRDTLAHYTQLGRAQTLEQAVTEYIKDCFASTVREKTNEGRNKKMASTFSQTGEDPTFTVMGGDAVRLAITEDKSAPATYHAAVEPVFVAEDGTSHPTLYITVVTDGKSGIRAIYAVYGSLYTAQGAVVPNPAEQFADLYTKTEDCDWEVMCLVPDDLYNTLHKQNRLELEALVNMGRGVCSKDVTVQTSSGPVAAKLFYTIH